MDRDLSVVKDNPRAGVAPMVEVDLIDLDAFRLASRRVASLRRQMESGQRLVPGFDALAQDVFAVFYKYNVVLLGGGDSSASVELNRRVLGWVLAAPGLEKTKGATRLDAERSGMAAAQALERVLDMLKDPVLFDQDDLLARWKLDMLEQRQTEIDEQLAAAEEIEGVLSAEAELDQEALEALREDLSEERQELRREVDRLDRAQRQELDRLPVRAENQVKRAVSEFSERLDEATEAADAYGSGLGFDSAGASASQKMALGEELLASEKLNRLARLVGLFKEVARASRKRRIERRPSAVHSIERGADLSRVLTLELAYLRHPQLRKEFLRRYVDGLLIEYAIRGEEQSGRGPLVVCIDASGSMRGPRELWAKAIALTFLEIARRERRAFRAIVFSSSADQVRRFELLESALDRRLRPPRVDPQLVVEFADYFPGGGTDFERPLRLALSSLEESRFKRGDVVFITDGEAGLSPAFLNQLEARKAELDFLIYGVLIDVRGGSRESLSRFSDEVVTVSELTAGELSEVFRRV